MTTSSAFRAHSILKPDVARAALSATKGDALLHAGTSLMLLAGLRPSEVRHALVSVWVAGRDPKLTIRGRATERVIRIAPSAASALGSYLADENAEPDEPLLVGLEVEGSIERAFKAAMRRAGLVAGVHDLRRAAVAAVLEDGTPPAHLETYFGFTKVESRKDLVPVREGYDRGIAAVLESTFGG